jgi:hypothetical protein
MIFPNRQEYRANHEIGIKNIEHLVFNKWKIIQTKIPIGCTLTTIAKNTITRENAPNLTFYVKGVGIVTNSNEVTIPNRVAGVFSGHRPDHPAGITKLTALEDIELWCCNKTHNRGRLPILTPIIITEYNTFTVNSGELYLVCYGCLDNKTGPFTIIGTTTKTLVANQTTYILKFES